MFKIYLILFCSLVFTLNVYPNSFTIAFQTGDLSKRGNSFPQLGMMYYDWSQQKQRIDHYGPAYECQRFYKSDFGCSLIFTKNGTYAYVPNTGYCCLDLPEIHASPPNWLKSSGFKPNGTQVINGVESIHWTKPDYPWHEYWSSVQLEHDFHVPIKFSFPDHVQDFNFVKDSFHIVDSIHPGVFDLPFEYCFQKC